VAGAVADGRRAATAWLSGTGILGSAADDVLIVLSELVTNGVVHGGGDDIRVAASTTPGCLHLEVITTARRAGTAPSPRLDPDFASAGRGLGIVTTLCQDVSIRTEPSGLRTVTCSINMPS
jgi:anti-sigma regulatory factor (Ser/Thr protein kinase)